MPERGHAGMPVNADDVEMAMTCSEPFTVIDLRRVAQELRQTYREMRQALQSR